MPTIFHGTSHAFATAMAGTSATGGTIDVKRGRGEFGRGFYAQDSSSNAARRGQTLYGNSSAVLILAIDDHEYHVLNLKRLTLNMAQMLNARGEPERNSTPTPLRTMPLSDRWCISQPSSSRSSKVIGPRRF